MDVSLYPLDKTKTKQKMIRLIDSFIQFPSAGPYRKIDFFFKSKSMNE